MSGYIVHYNCVKEHVLLIHYIILLMCDQAEGALCHQSCRKHVLQLALRHHMSCYV